MRLRNGRATPYAKRLAGVRLSAARQRALGASQAREVELTGGHALDPARLLADATAEVIAAA